VSISDAKQVQPDSDPEPEPPAAPVTKQRDQSEKRRENRRSKDVQSTDRGSRRPKIHNRTHSGAPSSSFSADQQPPPVPTRAQEFDAQSPIQASEEMAPPRSTIQAKNPIPAPVVTVRSEFPTINRSNQQQAITCLVSIEVPDGKWTLDEDDIRSSGRRSPNHQDYRTSASPAPPPAVLSPNEDPEVLRDVTTDLRIRCENWHGLDFNRFGKPRLYSTIKVGKDGRSWQELECYLFSEMLICVKEKKGSEAPAWEGQLPKGKKTKCTLKGSILIKKHLKAVTESLTDDDTLTLSLSVVELPSFHLQFGNPKLMELWKKALLDLNAPEQPIRRSTHDVNSDDEEEYRPKKSNRHSQSISRRHGTKSSRHEGRSSVGTSPHVPVDIVVVVPVTSSMQGMKISLLRDALRFLVQGLGENDRLGLVTFGSSGGGTPLVSMAGKNWSNWNQVLSSIKPVGQKSLRADVVSGANVAMDMLMGRKTLNPISSIFLISDAAMGESDSVDFVVSRAEAAK
jgi:hypothetical protein